MSIQTSSLLTILNTTNLQKENNRLYQVLQHLITNLNTNEQVTTVIAGGGGSTGFVTSSIGGTPNTISMFTAVRNIEDVTLAGISAALDLL